METIRQAQRADNAAVVDLWHCPSFKLMLVRGEVDGRAPERSYLASSASSMTKSGNLFLIEEAGRIVGTLNRFGGRESPEIGWFVAEARRGEGIATRSVAAFVDRLFEEGAESVRVGMYAANAPSLRIVEKLGLSPVDAEAGTPPAHARFAVTRREWEGRPQATAVPAAP
jgi:RimJ/RimL family protein N-acetyltransferase